MLHYLFFNEPVYAFVVKLFGNAAVKFLGFFECFTSKLDECITMMPEIESKFAGKGNGVPFLKKIESLF